MRRGTTFEGIARVSGDAPAILPERKYEVWHENPDGDWRLAYFDVPLGSRFQPTEFQERVLKEFESTVKKWAAMLQAEGEIPTSRPILNPNVYMCPEPNKQDYRRFYIAARVKRERPERMPLDSFAELAQVGHVDVPAQFRDFFEQMGGFKEGVADPQHLEQQARENATLPQRVEAERKELERVDYLAEHRR